jgi:chromate transporter
MTLGKDLLLWLLFLANAVITAWSESEIVWVFLLSGVTALLIRAPSRLGRKAVASAIMPLPAWLLSGLHGTASTGTLWKLGLYFAEAGAFVFGSGLAIVPFLYGGVVDRFHWLSDHQFLDAVAVAMITPGPVVITVAFIGYLVAGPVGATVAAIGVFLPCYLFVVVPAPISSRSPGTARSKRSWMG